MRDALAALELFLADFKVLEDLARQLGLFPCGKGLFPVAKIDDDRCGASVLRDNDRTMCRARLFKILGQKKVGTAPPSRATWQSGKSGYKKVS